MKVELNFILPLKGKSLANVSDSIIIPPPPVVRLVVSRIIYASISVFVFVETMLIREAAKKTIFFNGH